MSKFKEGDNVVRKSDCISKAWLDECHKFGCSPYGSFTVKGIYGKYTESVDLDLIGSWSADMFELDQKLTASPLPAVTVGDSEPKDMKHDQGKPRMDLLIDGCPRALEAVAGILTFGAEKYADHSWQGVERGEERYKAALLRHLTAVSKGEATDSESGMSHLAHAACNALFILELELRKNA